MSMLEIHFVPHVCCTMIFYSNLLTFIYTFLIVEHCIKSALLRNGSTCSAQIGLIIVYVPTSSLWCAPFNVVDLGQRQ